MLLQAVNSLRLIQHSATATALQLPAVIMKENTRQPKQDSSGQILTMQPINSAEYIQALTMQMARILTHSAKILGQRLLKLTAQQLPELLLIQQPQLLQHLLPKIWRLLLQNMKKQTAQKKLHLLPILH